MPFDTTPIIDDLKMLPTVRHAELVVSAGSRMAEAATIRPIPAWHSSLLSEQIGNTLRVLVRARALIADERRWCRRAFARGWGGIPVPLQSAAARRFCAVGAVLRAGREFGVPINHAHRALEWQTVRPVQDWNDDPVRTHSDVLAAFDAAIVSLESASYN
jgi:hypothetical protein